MPKTVFARKPVDLAQVKSDIEDMIRLFNSRGDAYYVAEELQISNGEWERLTDNLLEDRSCFHQFSERHLPTTKEGVPCIRVTAPGSQIALIIDTQGYDYARYVGIEENRSQIQDGDDEDGLLTGLANLEGGITMKFNDETGMDPRLMEEIQEALFTINHRGRSWQSRQLATAKLSGIATALHALADEIWSVEIWDGETVFINEDGTECIKSA